MGGEREWLMALAERCEKASGPDRDLDRQIDHVRWPVPQPAYHLELSLRDKWNVPHFTASIDAALTLVPDGWKWSLHSADHAGPPCAYCVPNMGRLPWPVWVDDVYAATPALALCAAALRARAEAQP